MFPERNTSSVDVSKEKPVSQTVEVDTRDEAEKIVDALSEDRFFGEGLITTAEINRKGEVTKTTTGEKKVQPLDKKKRKAA